MPASTQPSGITEPKDVMGETLVFASGGHWRRQALASSKHALRGYLRQETARQDLAGAQPEPQSCGGCSSSSTSIPFGDWTLTIR